MQHKKEEYSPAKHDQFKALSIQQPYAGYIADGTKTIEVRSRRINYRGDLIICSSKHGAPGDNAEGYGCTISKVELYDCKPLSELTPEEWKQTKLHPDAVKNFCKMSSGYGWFFRNTKKINQVPVKGQLGIFNLILDKGDMK